MANDAVVDSKVVRAVATDGTVLNLRVDTNGNLLVATASGVAETVKVADGTTPTQLLAVDASGRLTVAAIVGALPAGANAIGTVDTELPAAAALADGGAIPSTPQIGAVTLVHNGATLDFQRTPTTFKTTNFNGAATNTIWTPTTGKKFRLMGYVLMLTAGATRAGGGTVTISLLDEAAATGFIHSFHVPVAASTAAGVSALGPFNLGNGQLSAAANNRLRVVEDIALTAGEFRIIAWGTEE